MSKNNIHTIYKDSKQLASNTKSKLIVSLLFCFVFALAISIHATTSVFLATQSSVDIPQVLSTENETLQNSTKSHNIQQVDATNQELDNDELNDLQRASKGYRTFDETITTLTSNNVKKDYTLRITMYLEWNSNIFGMKQIDYADVNEIILGVKSKVEIPIETYNSKTLTVQGITATVAMEKASANDWRELITVTTNGHTITKEYKYSLKKTGGDPERDFNRGSNLVQGNFIFAI